METNNKELFFDEKVLNQQLKGSKSTPLLEEQYNQQKKKKGGGFQSFNLSPFL